MLYGYNVVITNHAVDKWRERVAVYGNEGGGEILDALSFCNQVIGEPLPFPREERFRYYKGESNQGVFYLVVEVYEAGGMKYARVVTVRTGRENLAISMTMKKVVEL